LDTRLFFKGMGMSGGEDLQRDGNSENVFVG